MDRSVKKFFPIRTATSCQLKWTWSTIYFYTGETMSCHRVVPSRVTPETVASFHNTEKKLRDRNIMLEGEWPSGGCEYCRDVEQAGGYSDRQFQLTIPNLTPPELEHDATAVEVTPRIVEIYLDNLCNMACIYCDDKSSSRIAQENRRFGEFRHGTLEIKNLSERTPRYDDLVREFWVWLENNYTTLRRLHLAGGEPFFQPQFETFLSFLETHKNPDLEFNIITNLKLPLAKLENFVARIKKMITHNQIGRIDITCSIDCWGAEQEYIRYGMDLSEWTRNFEYLVSQRWIKLNVNQTLTGIGMKSIVDLIRYVNQHRKTRKIEHYFMACTNKPHLNPKIFGRHFFDRDFDAILAEMPDQSWQDQHIRSMIEGMRREYNTCDADREQLSNLRVFLDEMDRRRGLDWRQVFPWLEKEIAHVV